MENAEIGNRIKSFRTLADYGSGLSSKGLAEELGISHDKLRNIECGRTALPLQLLLKLHNMGLDMHYLLTGEGSFFSDTEAGTELKRIVEKRNIDYPGRIIRAAAGRISK